jgi:hypothetical protein
MIRRFIGAVAVALLAMTGLSMPQAQAQEVAVFVGTANLNSGLKLVGLFPSVCTSVTVTTTLSVPVSVGFTGNVCGNCGLSNGSGTASIGSASGPVTFTSLGGTVILTASNGDIGGSISQARPLPSGPGDVPCVTSAAATFTLVGTGSWIG